MSLQRIVRLVGMIIVCLAIPFIGMQFSTQIMWSNTDFVLAAMLLLSTGMGYEIIRLRFSLAWQRVLIGFGVSIIMLICWAELAVGIFGTPLAGS